MGKKTRKDYDYYTLSIDQRLRLIFELYIAKFNKAPFSQVSEYMKHVLQQEAKTIIENHPEIGVMLESIDFTSKKKAFTKVEELKDIFQTISDFDIEAVKYYISPVLLVHCLVGVISKKQILLIQEQSFLKKHIKNFFKYLFQNSFKNDIKVINYDDYLKKQTKFTESLILKEDKIILDNESILNQEDLKDEKVLVQIFYEMEDTKFGLVSFKNEIRKVFSLAKAIYEYFDKIDKESSVSLITIKNLLKDNFKIKVSDKYLNFLNKICKLYFDLDVNEKLNPI